MKHYTREELGNIYSNTTHTTLQEFARDIIALNRSFDIDEAQLGTKEWIGHFHDNAKSDGYPNVSFEECQKVIWNELIK